MRLVSCASLRLTVVAAALFGLAAPSLAADEPPRGAAVTVLKATRLCFSALSDVSGFIMARDEIAVRPDGFGQKVLDVYFEPGEQVNSGQTLARLQRPEGGTALVQAPVTGLVSASTAVLGGPASGKGEALFSIIARSDFELVGLVPTRDLPRLAVGQVARVRVLGAGEMDGRVRRVAPTVEPNSQLGQVFITITASRKLLVNASGRAVIKTGESCGVSVPLTAVLYGPAGTVVQVVRRDRIETRRVEVGLMSAGRVEIREGLADGDIIVARAGALLREGDPVRAIEVSADTK